MANKWLRCKVCHACDGYCECDDGLEYGTPTLRSRLQYWRDDDWDDAKDWLYDHIPRFRLRRHEGRPWGISFGAHKIGNLFFTWYGIRAQRWVIELCYIARYNRHVWTIGYPKFVPPPPPEPPVEMHKVLEVRLSDGQQSYPALGGGPQQISGKVYPAGSSLSVEIQSTVDSADFRWIDCTCDSDPLGRCIVHTKVLGNPQLRSTMSDIKKAIEDLKYDNVVLIEPPVNALDRLSKALAQATKEGRGTKTIADVQIQFFNADSPTPGTRNTQTYAYIQAPSGNGYVSGYETWLPKDPETHQSVAQFDCYAVANEINALK